MAEFLINWPIIETAMWLQKKKEEANPADSFSMWPIQTISQAIVLNATRIEDHFSCVRSIKNMVNHLGIDNFKSTPLIKWNF